MKVLTRAVAAASAAALALLGLAACGGSSGSSKTTSAGDKPLTVWLMQDDYSEATVKAINEQFTKTTGAKVDVQVQQWDGITTKLDTALSTAGAPDVVDFGNTMVADYASTGALLDLTADKKDLAQGQKWLAGLEEPATYNGALYAVPGFAGNRAVIYNKQMWADAGITNPPTTYAELTADLDKIAAAHKGEADFSPFYLPGQNWYAGIQFVWDRGGEIAADKGGAWVGQMAQPNAIQGLNEFKAFQNKYSTAASRTVSIDNPEQEKIFADGKAAAILATSGVIKNSIQAANPKMTDDKIATFAFPSITGKGTQPVMLGGSVFGVPAKSDQRDLAKAWIKIAVSPEIQEKYIFGDTGWIPNSEEGIKAVQSKLNQISKGYFAAALTSKATPPAPGWASVSATKAPEALFKAVASGASTPEAAAKVFDDAVAKALANK
ncbi:MAG: extracellular solute-binding protein [Arcanobacterium sp.]|nr:extracellular solute-binding protein [Arcanobacterium sp.]